ncbi:MAG: epoxyqueuosine reductase, partial [Chloroflexota bacterium]
FEQETIEHAFKPDHLDYAAPKLENLLQLTQQTFKQTYANSPIKRIKRERLVRNAAVAAGNSGDAKFIPALKSLLNDKSDLVREHAGWAIKELDAFGKI